MVCSPELCGTVARKGTLVYSDKALRCNLWWTLGNLQRPPHLWIRAGATAEICICCLFASLRNTLTQMGLRRYSAIPCELEVLFRP
ncbi:hypothetical protein CEXT_713371 [Caerostris extrusa]|uniref:Uncharacterized protein n=1 Tax=Caerostris extrusa TaxID=172846 RepID=A0AAV4M5F9_CAEEX|nr:hypothetical protein CEXT_713371 [Caerostris extrusa]